MSEEEQGFVIRDKRGRSGSDEKESPPSAEKPPEKPDSGSETATASTTSETADAPRPPLTFSSFVFSLGSSALMLMGEPLDPQQPNPPVNLPQAKEIIDILSMLEEKTQGNLSTEEASVIRDMLYTLRMKYVSATSGSSSSISS